MGLLLAVVVHAANNQDRDSTRLVLGKLKATTIIDWLAEQNPGRCSASQMRTQQRRLQDWRR